MSLEGRLDQTNYDPDLEGGWLATELYYLGRYLGCQTVAEGIVSAGIRRVVEVGVGMGFNLKTITQLASLQWQGKPIFNQHDVWAIDPLLRTDEELFGIGALKKHSNDFVRAPIAVEDMMIGISGGVAPFDLVTSRGVVSIGGTMFNRNLKREYTAGLSIINSMKRCLNPENPNAMLMLFEYIHDMPIPCAPSYLESIGLEIVYGVEASGKDEDAREWIEVFKRGKIVPIDEPKFYTAVICKAAV